MKFFHLGDLHIGKTVNGFSMLEDQAHALDQVYTYLQAHRPDAVIIAGDVYDKTTPSAEATQLFDAFLTRLGQSGAAVLLISGNHDSPERLSFAANLLKDQGIHLCGVFCGAPRQVTLQDAYGPCHFHLMPFIKPAHVRAHFPENDAIHSYSDAMRTVLEASPPEAGARNVLIAHQFVAGAGQTPERSDSEVEPVGGIDAIPASLFDAYDYVALGHLHGPQQVGRPAVRYSGSLLKYSFSECFQRKSVCMVELGAKGDVSFDLLPLTPLHDMRKISGPLAQLTAPEIVHAGNPYDYLHVTLTDEAETYDPIGKLRAVYPNVMELRFDNARARSQGATSDAAVLAAKSPLSLFCEFYEAQNGQPPSDSQVAAARSLLAETEGA